MSARTKGGFYGHGDHGGQGKAKRAVGKHTKGKRPEGAPHAGGGPAAAASQMPQVGAPPFADGDSGTGPDADSDPAAGPSDGDGDSDDGQ